MKVNDSELTNILLSLPENLKQAINYEGGYRKFLQQGDEIEVNDGWVQMKPSKEVDVDEGWMWTNKRTNELMEKMDAEKSEVSSLQFLGVTVNGCEGLHVTCTTK